MSPGRAEPQGPSRVLAVVGTRPEAIKLAPVIKALRSRPGEFQVRICLTSQHREMLRPFLTLFEVEPDHDLDVMQEDQSPSSVAARVLNGIDRMVGLERPHWVVVQGDTTTVMAAAVAASYRRVAVGHVEAGLRTHNKDVPFPEEINRRVVGAVADLHFAPTRAAKRNLLAEGVAADRILVTGNTVIDALLDAVSKPFDPAGTPLEKVFRDPRRLLLVTAHRRESFGAPMQGICEAVRDISTRHRGSVQVLFPVHLNPHVREVAHRTLGGAENVTLTEPLDYFSFVHALRRSYLVLTDSGGVQEEAPSLGVPVLVMREVSERTEAVEAGVAKVVGTDRQRIIEETSRLLVDGAARRLMARTENPFGDGRAAGRIADALARYPYGVPQATPAAR